MSRKNSLVLLFLILFVLEQSSAFSQTRKKAKPKPETTHAFDIEPFNLDREELPPKYLGHALPSVSAVLSRRSAMMKRDEFEPTIDFNARMQRMRELPVVGRVKATDLFAFAIRADLVQLTSKYDADLSILDITLEWNPYRSWDRDYTYVTYISTSVYLRSYVGRNAFNRTAVVRVYRDDSYLIGALPADVKRLAVIDRESSVTQKVRASFFIPSPDARNLKANLCALIVGTLAPDPAREDSSHESATISSPYETYKHKHIVRIKPVAIWFYDFQTGRVYERIDGQ